MTWPRRMKPEIRILDGGELPRRKVQERGSIVAKACDSVPLRLIKRTQAPECYVTVHDCER